MSDDMFEILLAMAGSAMVTTVFWGGIYLTW